MFYVYEWFIKKTGEIIYVGKGCRNRYKVRKHNRLFNKMIEENECDSRIIETFDNEEDAFKFEFDRIYDLKSKGQCVCNIYSGGTGGTISWWTDENREKYSKNNVMKSSVQRKRMSEHNPMREKSVSSKVANSKKVKICIGDKVYDSANEIAEEYNVDKTAIRYWIKRGYAPNKEACYYFGDKKPEVVISDKRVNNGIKRAILINGVRYASQKDAAKAFGVNTSTIYRALKEKRPFLGNICEYDNQQPSQENSDNSILEGSTTNG